MSSQHRPNGVTAAIAAGCMVSFVSFGFAASFGVFLRPMSQELGWAREIFSLSLAIQAMFWGLTQPFAGMIADRYGTARVLAAGAIIAAFGFYLRATFPDPDIFIATGIIVGIGTGACSFAVVIVALGKLVVPERRSFVMGLGTAAASAGMFVSAPGLQAMIGSVGWQTSMQAVGASFLLILPALIFLGRVSVPTAAGSAAAGFRHAVVTAFGERSFVLLFTGFFVCGFHVAFIQTHLPAYIADRGLSEAVGSWSLAMIGLFNIAGSFLGGWAGQKFPKKNLLAIIYTGRALLITVFILTPITPVTVILFSGTMGFVWLAAVPLTTGLVAHMQGIRYLSTLVGVVFFGHQAGSFIGAWLGGVIYDIYGTYEPMWWAAVVLGLLATALHLPISERPGRLAQTNSAV